MEKRKLGRTGQMSSILTFGGFALYHVNQKEADTAIEMALEAGINQIDVSPFYGGAEARLGSWFKRHGNDFFLGCKTEAKTKDEAWEGLKRSLETLHVDHCDLFQFHGVKNNNELNTRSSSSSRLIKVTISSKVSSSSACWRISSVRF